jgi:hypothetical protein
MCEPESVERFVFNELNEVEEEIVDDIDMVRVSVGRRVTETESSDESDAVRLNNGDALTKVLLTSLVFDGENVPENSFVRVPKDIENVWAVEGEALGDSQQHVRSSLPTKKETPVGITTTTEAHQRPPPLASSRRCTKCDGEECKALEWNGWIPPSNEQPHNFLHVCGRIVIGLWIQHKWREGYRAVSQPPPSPDFSSHSDSDGHWDGPHAESPAASFTISTRRAQRASH